MTDTTTELLQQALLALNTAPRFRVGKTNSYKIASAIDQHLAQAKDSIAIRWGSEDVQEVRPDLTTDQAQEVLQRVLRCHDCNYGVTWDTLEIVADELFPRPGESR